MRFMKLAVLVSFALTGTVCHAADTVDAEFVVYDERFHDLIGSGSEVEVLADGFGWAEGPVWSAALDALLFSDVAEGTVYRWDASNGLSAFLSPSGHPPDDLPGSWRGSNGLAIDAQGRLVLAQQGRRTLARMRASLDDPAPDYESLVTEFAGDSINSPNDVVIHSSGDIYFTDPPYGLSGFENSPDIELDFFGVFLLSASGDLSLVTDTLAKPNGIALSPDQSTLYVSNSETGNEHVIAIGLNDDGARGQSRMFFDASGFAGGGEGSTDGMTVHPSGVLFVSVPGGFAMLSPKGELLGKVLLGQVTNLALDALSSRLYVTTPNRLLSVDIRGVEQ